MRPTLLAATALAALGLAAVPLMAEDHAQREDTPVAVSLAPDQLLAPYYAELRKKVVMPEAGPTPALSPATTLTRIAFGSCNHQSAPQHMWAQIAAQNPQLFLMIGDNVYGDNGWDADAGLESLRRSYALQASHPEFSGFRAKFPMMATWDDHDFGLNDAGGSFPMRRWGEELFETFWGSSDAVRSRPGVYDSTITGLEGKRVQVILLDTRFFRSDLKRMEWSRERPPLGSYLPDSDPAKTMLGSEQWAWLKAELAKPADLRILVSSVQVITDAHQFEGWTNMPAERAKLYDLLADREDSGLVILSGDRHAGGIYKAEHRGETLWELTSSSLNLAFGNDNDRSTAREPDPARTTKFFSVENYGLVDIDWKTKQLTMTLKGNDSGTLAQQAFTW
ncbi:alkaline phosphatase D family protein [Erythrobacter dokdonensis]|uniref:Putative phosphodiesterase/alkaline phosphatase D n=1 Tax=Erythrobacter dokdonensis DSW-74 TaxID=1300349 RepID=A0A1A7BFX9_9SPHN|nr:alkaline phosphatase D family protein [Erythrobacter dokdonensis]OBV11438.1 putative phosphodiesterase/alkaline phosphatase D [Erythrobacter dokdonensis DSW-74]